MQHAAIDRGQTEEQKHQKITRLRQEKSAEERRRSVERGEQAIKKIELTREIHGYVKDTENEQIKYNLQRIEEGKKNQYTGLKPLTLQQIQLNKKLRAEQQFEGMFIDTPQLQLQ